MVLGLKRGICGMEGCEVSNPHGIIVFGANGSGKTTLGRELARLLSFKHIVK